MPARPDSLMSVAIADGATAPDLAAGRTAAGLSAAERGVLALVAIGLVALYAPTVSWLIDRWTMSVWHNAHGMLIPVAVAYFAWLELRPLTGRRARSQSVGVRVSRRRRWRCTSSTPACIPRSSRPHRS